MGGLALVQGLLAPARLRSALAWASAQGGNRRGRWPLALALLANHGRFVAQERLVGVRDPRRLRERLDIVGGEHLAAARARGGVILLGFHVGPPGSSLALRLLGYPVASWHQLVEAAGGAPVGGSPSVSISGAAAGRGAAALHQARRHLAGGGVLYVTADGPHGTEACRLPMPGAPIVIRSGWLVLRRYTRAATLPLLAHEEGRRRIITVHPALPPPAPDPGRDVEACRVVLAALLAAYLRRFPEQCRATLWRA